MAMRMAELSRHRPLPQSIRRVMLHSLPSEPSSSSVDGAIQDHRGEEMLQRIAGTAPFRPLLLPVYFLAE
jgi:hypothetical protein